MAKLTQQGKAVLEKLKKDIAAAGKEIDLTESKSETPFRTVISALDTLSDELRKEAASGMRLQPGMDLFRTQIKEIGLSESESRLLEVVLSDWDAVLHACRRMNGQADAVDNLVGGLKENRRAEFSGGRDFCTHFELLLGTILSES